MLREGLEIYDSAPAGQEGRFVTAGYLGDALMGQLRYADAEPVFLLAANGILTGSGFAEDEKRLAIGRVISLYDAWGKPDKAAEWRAKLPKEAPATKQP